MKKIPDSLRNKLVANILSFQCAPQKSLGALSTYVHIALWAYFGKDAFRTIRPSFSSTISLPLKTPLVLYHESFVKLASKFGIVTSLWTNFAKADELCSPENKSLLRLLQMQIIVKIYKSRKSLRRIRINIDLLILL